MNKQLSPPSPHSFLRQRSARVKFQGSLLAIVRLQNGSHVRVPVHQLSANGGLLNLADPLADRTRVEVAVHVGSSTIRSQAEMLDAMWATRGCLQPFRFTDISGQQQEQLKQNLEGLLKKGRGRRTVGLQWNLGRAAQTSKMRAT